MGKAQILLVEDNQLTAKGLQYLLEQAGYIVKLAPDLDTAAALIAEQHFHLALLDVALPDGESFEFAHRLKSMTPEITLIFLTAKDREQDILHGLKLGADDYIVKPFRSRELLLRIHNHLARRHPEPSTLQYGVVKLDPKNGEVAIAGRLVVLTALENKLLTCLLEHSGHVVSRARLLDEIHAATGKSVTNNALTVYLKRLRQKLSTPGLIETLKNTGYRLNKLSKSEVEPTKIPNPESRREVES